MTLTLLTLGGLQASVTDAEGVTRTLGRGKPVAMLAYLAGIPGHKVSREHLAALLWGDVESEAARQNLRQTVWYLKKKLGENLLDGTGEMLSLAAPFTCDRDEFLQAAQRADFATAVRRYTGPFIPDFAAPGASEFEQWCELERRRLMVTFLRCADALARQWMGEGHFREAQELARRARDADPMDQATWRLLLEALIAGSDGLGAMSEAEHLEAFLAKEEQEPEAATIAALRAARRSPTIRAPSESSPSSSIAAELVGREAEFSHVLAAWDGARAGSPRVLVVAAAAGLGKSRLLRDLHARLRASRSRCVLLRANPGDRHLSGGFAAAVAAHLAEFPGAAAVSTGSAGVLVSLAPTLASLYPSAAPDASDGEDAVRRRALALADLLHAVSDEHPVAMLLDDLHWADEHSVRVIAAALSRLEHARLLVVLTRRPVADPQALLGAFEQLALPPLDLAAVNAFVTQVAELPATAWADVLPQQLLLATGGSPLLLVETLHDALEQGWLSVSDAGVWECDDPLRVTNSLREGSALEQRVARLTPEARHPLLALALLGRPVELDEARAMMAGNAVMLEEPLVALERGGFVARKGTQLAVAHDEIADAVVEMSAAAERERLHSGIARHLLARAQDENALRRAAEHARLSGDEGLLPLVWKRFLERRRHGGDRRATVELAVDLCGESPQGPLVKRLVRATPYWSRRRSRWHAGAAAMVVGVAALIGFWVTHPAPVSESVFALWVTDSLSGTGRLVGVRIPEDISWSTREPLNAVELSERDFPRRPDGSDGPLAKVPGAKVWWTHALLPSLGGEGVLIDSLGRTTLPLSHRGDDAIEGVSPDGRWLVANSARWDTLTDHVQLGIQPLGGTGLRRLTFGTSYDYTAHWKPDGTQILFFRRFFDQPLGVRFCLIDFDGNRERCLPFELTEGAAPIGWIDNQRLLFRLEDHSLDVVDVETLERHVIPGLRLSEVDQAKGDVMGCICQRNGEEAPSFYVFPRNDPTAARAVLYRGRPLRGTLRYVAPARLTRQWLETLKLRTPPQPLSVDLVHRLVAEGHLANGAAAEAMSLRWTSRDTTVATVDSTGRLRPRRTGEVWVVVTAGGWRTDSTRIRISAPTSVTVLRESWDARWTERWKPFGSPPGTVKTMGAQRVFYPNGDGSYASGAMSRQLIDARRGAGVEAMVRLPISAYQWQTLVMSLMAARRLRQAERENIPDELLVSADFICSVGFPGGEGIRAVSYLTLAGSPPLTLAAPKGLYAGAWHRVRLQLLEDNRCGLAIDGKPLGIQTSMTATPDTLVFLTVLGNERFNGQLIVGPLEAWSGVRGGVDWSKLDAEPIRAPPR